jgi:hypothetical protein
MDKGKRPKAKGKRKKEKVPGSGLKKQDFNI